MQREEQTDVPFNPQEFGQILVELRGPESQRDVEKGSGVPQHRISAFERGEVQDPGIVTLLQLTSYLGLNPNETAAAAGLYVLDDSVEEQFPPEIARVLEMVRNYMLRLETVPRQRRFAQLLEQCVREMREIVERDELLQSSRLPDYIRRKVRHPLE